MTIFPEMFPGPLGESLVGKAQERGLLRLEIVDLRHFANDSHRTVDDTPYGGGGGMVMMAEPFFAAADACSSPGAVVVCPTPQGQPLTHIQIADLAHESHIIVLCGHYEGIDQRVRDAIVQLEFSLGDYVLTGGELPAMVLVDAVARQIPGVIGDFKSVERDSFYDSLLDHPHYTRPREVRGLGVPEVLLSGDHRRIDRWRREQSLQLTARRRPDLLANCPLSSEDRAYLASISAGEAGS